MMVLYYFSIRLQTAVSGLFAHSTGFHGFFPIHVLKYTDEYCIISTE